MSAWTTHELVAVEDDWGRAMVRNDADAIGRFMAEDWRIVGSDGGVLGKAAFLELVRSGTLTHDTMETQEVEVRAYGETAVVTARGVSGGTYRGQAFRDVERVSDVWVRSDGRWLCVLTHLSRIAAGA